VDAKSRPSLATLIKGHIQIARFDHWVKNVFVLPGIVIPLTFEPFNWSFSLLWRITIGILSLGLVASSNYVINELMDAPFDRFHPSKSSRPVVQGRISIPLAYLEWILLGLAGLALALRVSTYLFWTDAVLWGMGCIYNIPPIRTKDVPFIDVLSESLNNPLRLLAGWFIVTTSVIPPASLLLCYWMVGCYFMGLKRFSEYRQINDHETAAHYRKSFANYNEISLLTSVMFYAATAMLFFGAFIMRYRLELILSFPFVALVMAVYLRLAFDRDSVVQRPEGLYRQPLLVTSVIGCAIVMLLLVKVDLPKLHQIFAPTMPTAASQP
jgi:decaprenyl-phosphate phosphoribosyltransferase